MRDKPDEFEAAWNQYQIALMASEKSQGVKKYNCQLKKRTCGKI